MSKSALVPKVLLILGGILTAAYLGLCVFLRLWQTRLIFFPTAVIKATPADMNLPYEEVWMPVAKKQIHGWWIPAATDEDLVLLYLHGNGSNIGDDLDSSCPDKSGTLRCCARTKTTAVSAGGRTQQYG